MAFLKKKSGNTIIREHGKIDDRKQFTSATEGKTVPFGKYGLGWSARAW